MKLSKWVLLIFLLVSVVSGTNRYISTTGSDANDGTYEHPWATFSYALCGGTYGCGCVETNPNLVSSGDTLFVRGGYYDVSSEITNKYILIGNSGTKNAPLVIKAFHGETPIIDGKYANELFVLGDQISNNYVVFDSLFLMRGTRALIRIRNNAISSNVTIKNCRLMGTYVQNDYNAAVMLENGWDSTYVYNNYITGDTIINRPSQAIELYTGGNNCKIFNNTIRYVTRGIYYKRGNIYPDGARKFYIANNYINDVVSHGIDICADSGVIINNLIVGARGAGIAIYGENSGGCDRVGAFHNQIINNTVVDCNLGIELGYTGGCPQKNARYTKVFRNVVRNNNQGVLRIWPYAPADSINKGGTTADSNVFYSTIGNYMYNWSTEYTLSTHKAASNINLNSLFGSIVFVDSAGGNFSLAATSTGYGFGAGVNMDSVGIIPESAQSSPVVISVQPRDTTVNDGSTATFTIAATNATGYQWYGNGSLIPDATNSVYSFTATLALSGSSIYCRVTNATDTVWSDTATLTVTNDRPHYRTWISSSSTDMSLSTNYSGSGPLLTTDTLVFNNISVVNATATANLNVASVIVDSTYSGNWSISGFTMTLNTGNLDLRGTGTYNLGSAININGNGTYYVASTTGVITATSCVLTINSTINQTITDNKSVRYSNIIVNGPVYSNGTGRIDTRALSGTSPLTLGANGSWTGPANMALRSSANTVMINMQPTSIFNPSGEVYLVSSHGSGSITLTIPEINCEAFFYFENWGTAGNSVIYSMSGDLNCYKISTKQSPATSGNVTLQTNGNDVRAFMWYYGSQKLTCRGYLEADNSYISIYDFEGNNNTDSTFWSLNNATVHNSNKWVHGTKELFAGTYALQTFTDLYMGHSMFSAQQIIAPPQYWYEKNYAGRYWKNRSIGSQLISEVNTRLDSCLTAYSPSRFFMYIGQNDLDITDSATFDAAMVSYYIEWTDIINRVKAANIDSIYIVEMSPTGTIAAPMAAERVRNYRRFNISLRDSCNERGLFFIPTFDSLLEPGYNDVLKVSTTIDGVHPNSTISGSQYTGYLLTLAQAPTVTFRQSTDTLKLVCSNNQNVESWQWYKNNVAISGATDSVLSVVVDSTSATKSVYYCEISNGAENKKVGDWTIERKANGRVVSRKNKYK